MDHLLKVLGERILIGDISESSQPIPKRLHARAAIVILLLFFFLYWFNFLGQVTKVVEVLRFYVFGAFKF